MASTSSVPLLSSLEFGPDSVASILFIPGWEMSAKAEAYDFEPIFTATLTETTISDEIYKRYKRIYVDLPGMGETPADGVKDLDGIFYRLVSFINFRLGSTRPFLLAGTSCGGYLARAVARHYQSRVLGLLLRVPVIVPNSEARDVDPFVPIVRNDKFMADVISELPIETGFGHDLTLRAILKGDILVQTPEYVLELKKKYQEVFLPAMRAADASVLGPIRNDPARYRLTVPLETPLIQSHPERSGVTDTDDFSGGLDSTARNHESPPTSSSSFPVPTLIVTGRQDTDVGYRDACRILSFYERATFVTLDHAGHDLPVGEGQTRVFRALVVEWLRRVQDYVAVVGHGIESKSE
ncbi:hypothetical protein LTR84_012976 [Exophiala bonariae]|uniref:AB hydrolase-1 domain-containing protein n=1 Tax=Exophiala bonariae TaxID=1690606 RepID=A0AAV9NHZ8_9EURO|nr:hypothetical protein LTR84_012976 [Exophiala bonariae]